MSNSARKDKVQEWYIRAQSPALNTVTEKACLIYLQSQDTDDDYAQLLTTLKEHGEEIQKTANS